MKQVNVGVFSKREQKDLFKAWASLSLAFAIVLSNFSLFSSSAQFFNLLYSFIVAGITVGIGFIVHEMSHKFLAQKYGCRAEFRAFDKFLIIAILMALFLKIIIAAPGAVMISGPLGRKRNGKVSTAGPLSNLVVAALFLGLFFVIGSNIFTYYGFFINSLLAAFNIIPFGMFDGKKIMNWSKTVWTILAVVSGIFMYLSFTIF